MRRHYLIVSILALAVLLFSASVASAQTGQLRGSVKLMGADGNATPVANAIIDVYRTDVGGDFHTKSDKKGEWIFAGLPYVGTYVVAVSAPGAGPMAQGGVKAGRDVPIDLTVGPGNGRKLTRDEAIAAANSGGPAKAGGESAADKAKAAFREGGHQQGRQLQDPVAAAQLLLLGAVVHQDDAPAGALRGIQISLRAFLGT